MAEIKDAPSIMVKENPTARAALSKAFASDERIKANSEMRSREYLENKKIKDKPDGRFFTGLLVGLFIGLAVFYAYYPFMIEAACK